MTYINKIKCQICNKEIVVRTSIQRCCAECKKIIYNEWRRRYYSDETKKERHSKIVENWRLRNLDKKVKNQNKYMKKNKQIVVAHQIAKTIPINSECNICHSTENLHRHHWRYDKPLLINTLCKPCHQIQHIKFFEKSRFALEVS